jgi:RNA methyltransferase, TrmH family
MKPVELKVCGLAAVRARFAHDAASIQRLFFDNVTGRKIGVMCKTLAASRKVYRCVEPAELEKIAGTLHHGGIVAVVSAPVLKPPLPAEIRTWAGQRAPLLLLDRIGNAHNLGAIARTAGFFGVRRIVLPNHPEAALPGEAAYRVAEGGMEAVEIFRVPDFTKFMRDIASAGYEVIGAAARGGSLQVAASAKRPDHSAALAAAKPIALVLGSEEHGLSVDVSAACTRLVTIPGSGEVESLNVSVAAAVLMWELIVRAPRGNAPRS